MLTHGERVIEMAVVRFLRLMLSVCSSGFVVVMLLFYNGIAQPHELDPMLPSLQNQMQPAQALQPTQQTAVIMLPCIVDGTDLVVEKVVCYEGEFLENDSRGYVVNTAAVLLRNAGETGIRFAEVRLKLEDKNYTFLLEWLPAGMSALVLERDGKAYTQQGFSDCCGSAVYDSDLWLPETITTEPFEKGSLLITNHSDSELAHICVYYRTFYSSGSFYLGGKTHSCCIEELLPGEKRWITPEFYAGEHSAVVRITT
jgi:hypothetical protein